MKDDLAPQERPAGLTMREFFQGANTLNLAPGLTFSGGWSGGGTSQWPLSPATDSNYIVTDNFSHIAGKHTLQVVLGDYLHIPHDTPVVSEMITITVK